MEIYERIRHLRKSVLKLPQKEFGARLGVSRSVIANIELNVLARPGQKEPLYKLICKEFNINQKWLMTGEGSILSETMDDFITRFAAETGVGFYIEGLIRCYLNLNEEQRQVFDSVLKALAELWNAAPGEADAVSVEKAIDMAIKSKPGSSEPDGSFGPGNSSGEPGSNYEVTDKGVAYGAANYD